LRGGAASTPRPRRQARAQPIADPSAIPPLRDLRYRIEYAVLRLLIGIVRLLPIDVAGTISA
jgi:hypothetical protein